MKLIVCTGCDQRVNRCTCSRGEQSWREVELYTPAEVEARLHRLLEQVAENGPSAAAACRRMKADVMALSEPKRGQRVEPRTGPTTRQPMVGRKLG